MLKPDNDSSNKKGIFIERCLWFLFIFVFCLSIYKSLSKNNSSILSTFSHFIPKTVNTDTVNPSSNEYNANVIVIDPGHGGRDSGKIGINNIYEKDINIKISLLLKTKLEALGYKVVMTRMDDNCMYEETDSNKKSTDLKNRCNLINETKPYCTIGIHQNSYPSQNVKGAQVFYYKKSQLGRKLALSVQKSLIENVDSSNKRMAKPNDNYYMLLHNDYATIIVECGFLSCLEEANKLNTSEYQEKIADAIAMGIKECH